MLIRNIYYADLHKALDKVNKKFGGNVVFNRFEHAGHTRTGLSKYNVTLRVISSKEPGHRLSIPDAFGRRAQRRMIAACWHVHGFFIDALPPQAEVISSLNGRHVVRPGDEWQDAQVGSQILPAYLSELCDCGSEIYES